jgi:cytidylate kinase
LNPKEHTNIETLTNVVTIDGPAGAGKSTIARRVASRLGYAFLDTGAMYRSATWWAMHRGIDLANPDALIQSTRYIPLEMEEHDGALTVRVDGIDVSEAIRTPEVTNNIKCLDGIAEVREKMVGLQRKIAAQSPTVADGRDMGTVVFPKARAKIFLEASLEERTRRRALELEARGIPFNPDELKNEIHARDENDRNRAVSPLKPADDAYILDTSTMTLDEVETTIVQYVKDKS